MVSTVAISLSRAQSWSTAEQQAAERPQSPRWSSALGRSASDKKTRQELKINGIRNSNFGTVPRVLTQLQSNADTCNDFDTCRSSFSHFPPAPFSRHIPGLSSTWRSRGEKHVTDRIQARRCGGGEGQRGACTCTPIHQF